MYQTFISREHGSRAVLHRRQGKGQQPLEPQALTDGEERAERQGREVRGCLWVEVSRQRSGAGVGSSRYAVR